VAALITLIAPG